MESVSDASIGFSRRIITVLCERLDFKHTLYSQKVHTSTQNGAVYKCSNEFSALCYEFDTDQRSFNDLKRES